MGDETPRAVHLNPGDRMMVPTGLAFDIPDGYFVRLYSRSGLSLQNGLRLVNGTGIIDSDYKEEVFMLIENTGGTVNTVMDETRLCQGELVKTERVTLCETDSIEDADSRGGGFGSTGVGDVKENG
jgi:dUTP pyrophosphatase